MSAADRRCAICGHDRGRLGNNPAPLALPKGSQICDACNATYALRARLGQLVIGPDGTLLFNPDGSAVRPSMERIR
jgi:hypothetical protein